MTETIVRRVISGYFAAVRARAQVLVYTVAIIEKREGPPTIQRLAALTGFSRETIRKAALDAERLGLITIDRSAAWKMRGAA